MNRSNSAGSGGTSRRRREHLIEQLRSQGIKNEEVLDVILHTPRHIFVDEALASHAYDNQALPIGHNQTISQPYIVAKMTEILLDQEKPRKVLEVGTGCGYQTVVLSQLVEQVYTVERIQALLQQARKRFRQLEIYNIHSQHTDGQWGWKTHAPYDGILVTAAPATVPEALLEQLAVGGRLVIPVGEAHRQKLRLITRKEEHFERVDFESVSFVPLLGGQA